MNPLQNKWKYRPTKHRFTWK